MNYIINNCDEKDEKMIVNGIIDYNNSKVPYTQDVPFQYPKYKILIDGEFAGGILGKLYCWDCLYIDILFVVEKYRNMGVGKALLDNIENYGKKNGAYLIHLDTFDFQAKDFYLKNGYSVFGELTNCPKSHSRYFMKKELF
jgi:GNAT superfamily N-acetyltransferase